MIYLKYFENVSSNNKKAKYIQDFIINICVFIDSIRKTWDNPNDFSMKVGSTSFSMFIKGVHGKEIFNLRLKEFDKWYIMSLADYNYFSGGNSSQPPDCIRYINFKIAQQIGDITTDKLEKLYKIKFTIEEMSMYLETEKYNL